MNRIKRAIILAAGKGTRLRPITFEIPKPLIKVNGIRMIDTIIDTLYKNGICEIYIVVGYLKERFQELLLDYPNLQLIENPYYDTCNNVSSLYVARNYLEDVLIADADQIIYNENILKPEFENSGYNCVWNKEYTKEWLLELNQNGIIKKCSKTGGKNGWQLYSISRWNKEDGKVLKQYLEEEFINKKNTQIYWDDIALFCYPEKFKLGIYEMEKSDIVEIDNLQELIILDNSYKKYTRKGSVDEI